MTKRYYRPPRDYQDQELTRAKSKAKQRIRELLAEGTVEAEEEFVGLLKEVNEAMTPEELVEWVTLFRDAANERGPYR